MIWDGAVSALGYKAKGLVCRAWGLGIYMVSCENMVLSLGLAILGPCPI